MYVVDCTPHSVYTYIYAYFVYIGNYFNLKCNPEWNRNRKRNERKG